MPVNDAGAALRGLRSAALRAGRRIRLPCRLGAPQVNAAWAMPAGPAGWVQHALLADPAARPDEMLSLPFCAVHCLCCGRDITAGQPPQALDDDLRHLTLEIHNLAGHSGLPAWLA
jgi:hypothetical protein